MTYRPSECEALGTSGRVKVTPVTLTPGRALRTRTSPRWVQGAGFPPRQSNVSNVCMWGLLLLEMTRDASKRPPCVSKLLHYAARRVPGCSSKSSRLGHGRTELRMILRRASRGCDTNPQFVIEACLCSAEGACTCPPHCAVYSTARFQIYGVLSDHHSL
jgi:hypothetical protein